MKSHAKNSVDPVFAAIDAHRAATTVWKAVLDEQQEIEEKILSEGQKLSQQDSSPRVIANRKRYKTTHRIMDKAEDKLCRTVPTTLAGISARMFYMIEVWNIARRGFSPVVEAPSGQGSSCLKDLMHSTAACAEAIEKDGAKLPQKFATQINHHAIAAE